MQDGGTHEAHDRSIGIVRVGGVAVLFGLAIHIVTNMFLKEYPTPGLAGADLEAYLASEADMWALIHGAKTLAFPCLAVFYAGMFARTSVGRDAVAVGWGVVGLVGGAMHVTNVMMVNAIETFAFMPSAGLSDEQFWLLFDVTGVLFTAEIIAWAIAMFGFSMAGRRSRTLPLWLSALGFVSAAGGVAAGAGIVSVLTEGPAVVALAVAALCGLAWFLASGVLLLIRGGDGGVR